VTGARIFISYRRGDSSAHAGRLADRLGATFGENRVFMDVDTIEPGADFVEYIERAVGSCDVLIALIGDAWLDSRDEGGNRRLDDPDDFVRLEVAAGLERDIRVVPVLVEGATMPRADQLPEPLRRLARRNALEISDSRWRHDAGRLIDTIQKVLEGKGTGEAIREAEAQKLDVPGATEGHATQAGATSGAGVGAAEETGLPTAPPQGPPVYAPPPPPTPGWQAPASTHYTAQPTARPNTKATVALILGLIGILTSMLLGLGALLAVPAIILGAQAKGAAERGEALGGVGMAKAGVWTGVIGILGAILFWVLIAIDVSNDPA
jgi:hypothetical protein